MAKNSTMKMAVALIAGARFLQADAVYFNRQDWQQALRLTSGSQPVSVGLSSNEWTDTINIQSRLTQRIHESTTAASDGMSVWAVSGYSAPGIVDNATLGHMAGGLWTDELSKYGATTFSFSQAISGFGGDFVIAGPNGLFIGPAGEVGGGASSYTGFIGFITSQPVDSVLITWGQDAHCPYCVGNAYTLANLQVVTTATPEPNFRFAIAGLFLVVAAVYLCRYCRV